MKGTDRLRFALQALTRHRLRSLLSLVGMAIGIAAVIVLTSLAEGARRYVTQQFASIGTDLLVVLPGRTETTGAVPGNVGVPNDLTLEDAESLKRSIPAIEISVPLTMNTETVAQGERRRQVAVLGSTENFLRVYSLEVGQGQFLSTQDAARGGSVVVLGAATARELFPGENAVGKVVRIGSWRVRVIGVLASKGAQLGINMDEIAVMPVATTMRLFNRTSLFRILAQLSPQVEADETALQVIEVLKQRHGEEDFTIITHDAVLSTFASIMNALTFALAAIAAVSLTVAGVGIMNVMLVSVSERTAEVGLLKALGAGPRQILGIFVTEAALLSTAGGLCGLAFGWSIVALTVRLYPALPASPPTWAVVSALVVSTVVGVLFGVLPARTASRLDPVEALGKG
ncbi:MAG: ABC transporter permease [Deltaproteobacteria bacterium]|nr:ABC transporter permease [Deltaproteobacteria bacterium]